MASIHRFRGYAVVGVVLIAAPLFAQTTGTASRTNDNTFAAGKTQTFLGVVDAGGATRTLPCRTGSGAPTGQNGTRGDCYYNTAATAGQNLWWATATGTPATWTQAPVGGVTSVAFTGDGVVFNASVPGSPVTVSGTFAPTLHTQSANTVFAGPTSGGAATPTFRGLVSGDIPNNAANTSGNAATATALAANPTDCSAGLYANAIDAQGNLTCGTPAGTAQLHSFSFTFDGGGSTPAAQDNGFYPEAFYNCTINRASISSKSGTVGSASVDIWAKANANPTSADKISASAPVSLSSSANAQNVSLSGWTTAITSGMRIGAYLSSATTLTGVIVQVWCQ